LQPIAEPTDPSLLTSTLPSEAVGSSERMPPPTCSKEANRYKVSHLEERDDTAYRRAEKQYRRQRVPVNKRRNRFVRRDPDLAHAIDFAKRGSRMDQRVLLLETVEGGREIYSVRDRPGFYYIRGALTWQAQVRWARRCLTEFSRSPFTNITNHIRLALRPARDMECPHQSGQEALWDAAVRRVESEGWEGGDEEDGEEKRTGQALQQALQDLYALRWANLGANYIWTTRKYAVPVKEAAKEETGRGGGLREGETVRDSGGPHATNRDEEGGAQGTPSSVHSRVRNLHEGKVGAEEVGLPERAAFPPSDGLPVPQALTDLAREVLEDIAHAESHRPCASKGERAFPLPMNFRGEAGIVNYYPPESSMGGHVDDAEGATSVPLVSFSLGLGCVFLLGGKDKEVAPVPLVFRSGDCMVMAGEARLAFHGVPCILEESAGPDPALGQWTRVAAVLREDDGASRAAEARMLSHYLTSSRLNFNVRQVWRRELCEGAEGLRP